MFLNWSINLVCGGELNFPSGNINSPYYPDNYIPKLNCVWKISVPSNHVIRLIFTDFKTEENQDCVFIYDGLSFSTSSLLRKICGSYTSLSAVSTVTSTTNFMIVKFTTDSSVNHRGFNAFYTAIQSGRKFFYQKQIIVFK